MHAYILDNSTTFEFKRLNLMSRLLDPMHRSYVEMLGIAPGWHVMELGPGNGSMSEWMCGMVGLDGVVTAVDLNPQMVELIPAPNLVVRQADVRQDALPSGPFDLVTTRAMLHQFGDYAQDVLVKMADTLAPGGWLLVYEPDFTAVMNSGEPAYRDAWQGIVKWGEDRGIDWHIGAKLPSMVSKLGLESVQANADIAMYQGGKTVGAEYFRMAFEFFLGKVDASYGLEDRIKAALAAMDDESKWFDVMTMRAVWARKALA